MKRSVFKCYKEFYKEIFYEEDYEKIHRQVYRFLVDAAGDGSVMPAVIPGAMKLGKERISVSAGISKAAGIFLDTYRESKLLERYLQTVALRQELELSDVKLLLYFSQTDETGTLKEIAAVTHLKKTKVLLSLQRLGARNILKVKGIFSRSADEEGRKQKETYVKQDKKERKHDKETDKIDVEFLPQAEEIIEDIMMAKDMYDQVKYAGLSEEELEQYELITEKIRNNIRKSL